MKPSGAARRPRLVRKLTSAVIRSSWLWATAAGAALVAARVPEGELPWALAGALILWGDGRWWPPIRSPRLAIPVGAFGFGLICGPFAAGAALAAVVGLALALSTRVLSAWPRWAWWQSRLAIRQAWPEVAAHAGWADTALRRVEKSRLGAAITVRWPAGARPPWQQIGPKVSSVVRRDETMVKVSSGSDAGEAVIDIRDPNNVLGTVHPHPGLADPPPTKPTPIPIGVADDTRTVYLDWQHTLVGGQSGGGKSGVLQAILVHAAPLIATGKVELWIADPKEGAELGDYRDAATLFAEPPDVDGATADESTAELWDEFVRRVHREMRRRMQVLRDSPHREWKPSLGPLLLVVIDEVAEVFRSREAAERAVTIANQARAAGVVLVVATQYPTKEAIPTRLSTNFPQTVGTSTKNATGARIITGDRTEDAPIHKLPPPKSGNAGQAWVMGSTGYWQRARIYWVDDRLVAQAATQALGDRPPGARLLPPTLQERANEDPSYGEGSDVRARPDASPKRRPAEELANLRTAGFPQASKVWDLAAAAGVEGLAGVEGRQTLGMKESTWTRHVGELERAGLLERLNGGRVVRALYPSSDETTELATAASGFD